jgi:uncharacterized protein (TIGR00369 family)
VDRDAASRAFAAALATERQAFGEFFIAKFFGFRISYAEDTCLIAFDVRDYMFNPQGSLHGGIIATALDIAMGHLIHHVTGASGITLELKTQYLRSVPAGPARCEGRFLKRGRSLSFMESRLWNSEQKLAAHATATWQMPRGAVE